MTVLITMAGRGSRFRDVGYTVPKYEIVAKGKTLFEWSMISLKPILRPETRVIFVTLTENNAEHFLKTECGKLGLRDVRVVTVDQMTDGQATTALVGLKECEPGEPVAIYNIDTHIDPESWSENMIPASADGWVLCFDAPGDHWSFAKVDGEGWATEFAEKVKISDHATVGLYHFRNPEAFERAYQDTFLSGRSMGGLKERYIAPMYNSMIEGGQKIAVSAIPFDAVVPLGTPDELNRFLQSTVEVGGIGVRRR